MRDLWRDEPGWVIAIALIVLLVVIAGLRSSAQPQQPIDRPAVDYCHWPSC